jgi:hypothetical protein
MRLAPVTSSSKLAYIFAYDEADASEPPCQGADYGPVAIAVRAFLEQRAA